VQRNLAEISDDDSIIAGAKVVYFVNNDVNPADLRALTSPLTPLEEDSLLWRKFCAGFNRRKSKWQNSVISHVEATVVKCMTAWVDLPANRGQEFKIMTKAQRYQVWLEEQRRHPRGIAREMWKSVGGIKDWGAIFDTPAGVSEDDIAKLGRVKTMLVAKWLFACEQVCQYVATSPATPLPGFSGNIVLSETTSLVSTSKKLED
jgi:hypothetical protein